MRWRPYLTLAWRDAKLNNYYYGVPGLRARRRAQPRARRARRLPAGRALAGARRRGRDALVERRERQPGGRRRHAALRHARPHVRLQARPGERVGPPAAHRAAAATASRATATCSRSSPCSAPARNTQDDTSIVQFDVGQILVRRAQRLAARHRRASSASSSTSRSGPAGRLLAGQRLLQALLLLRPVVARPAAHRASASAPASPTPSRIPFTEQRDQALRGRDTSKLLLYLDPTIDINVGDLFGAQRAARDLRRHRRLAPLGHLRLVASSSTASTAARTTSTPSSRPAF